MKSIVFLVALVAVACAQTGGNLGLLIEHEVSAILTAQPGTTLSECVTMCDDLFDLVDPMDEALTHKTCMETCDCHINNICPNATATVPPAMSTTDAPAMSTTDAPAMSTTDAPAQTTAGAPATTHGHHHTHPPHPTHPQHTNHGHHGN